MNRVSAISDAINQRTENQPLDWLILMGLFLFAFFLVGYLVQRRKQNTSSRVKRIPRDQQPN